MRYSKIRMFLLMMACMMSSQLKAGNVLKIGQYSVTPNTEVTILLEAENDNSFVAFQVDVPIPEGFKYVDGSAVLNASRISGHVLSANLLTGNILRLIGYSVNNTPFVGNSGALMSFKLKSGTVPSTYSLALSQPMLGNSLSQNILTSAVNGSVTVLAPNIQVSTTSIDFGRVPLQTAPEQTFQLTNQGNSDLIINGLTFNDSQFTTASGSTFTITPNSSRSVSVKFTPTAKGVLAKQLQISSNDPDQATSTIALNAVAFAVNEIHTGSITGASSSSATLDFTLNNMEAFTGFQFDLALPSPMTYIAGSGHLYRSQDQTVSVSQINAQTLRVLVYSSGNKNFTGNDGKVLSLDFSLNGTAGYYYIGMSNIVLANTVGENILSASYNGNLNITSPDIDANTQVAFGDVSILSHADQTLRINNYGQEPLTITQLMFSSAFFTSSQTLPVTIPSYGTLDLPVVFSKTTEGIATGTMRIFSNDPDENPFTIQLSGNAFIPNYFRINPITFLQRERKLISVEVDNVEPFVALQFDLNHPAGFTPDLNAIVLTDRKQDHVVMGVNLSATVLRILVYSPGQKTFKQNVGAVVQIPFVADADLTPGTYPLIFSNALLSDVNSQNILYASLNGSLEIQQYYDTVTWNGTTWSTIPTANTQAIIEGDYFGAGFTCHNLTIKAGKNVSVLSGTLSVEGNLYLKSDLTGPATFMENGGTLSLSGSANVEQYVTGVGGSTPSGRFWYLTSPVAGATSTAFNASGPNKIWSYNEAGGATEAQVYTEITDDVTNLNPGYGYVARMAGNDTINFTGSALINGDRTINLGYTTSSPKPGFNLIGNPYPSYLNIKTALNATNKLETTIWCRSYNSTSNTMVFDTYNAFSGLEISTPSGNTALADNIPPMQAFWVRAKQAGNFTLTNAMRSHQASGIKLRNTLVDIPKVRLQVSNGINLDQTVIAFYPDAVDAFDNYDSRKMFNGVAAIPEVYTLVGTDPVAINGLAPLLNVRELVLGFRTAMAGSFTLQATEIQNLTNEQSVLLKDKLLNVEQDLTKNPTYTFNSEAVSSIDRFSIVIGKVSTNLKTPSKINMEVLANDHRIEVRIREKVPFEMRISVFNTLGQELANTTTNSQATVLSNYFNTGVYFVNVVANGVHETRKVLITP